MNLPNPFILDGGLSNEIEALGCDLNHPLWTAKCIEEDPNKVVQVHLNYLNAGANCIATMSYQASIPGLIKHGYSKNEAKAIIQKSVDLAVQAREVFKEKTKDTKDTIIAASIGPYGAYLADGSEYNGNYKISVDELREFHAERLSIFAESKADLLAFETFPDYNELKVIDELIRKHSKKCWVSFSCKNESKLADGTPLGKCAELFLNNENVIAIGANCIAMEWVAQIISNLKTHSGDKRIIIYPNGGGYFDSEEKVWKNPVTGLVFEEEASKWMAMGASMIGGCCRIGSKDINRLHQCLH